MLSRLDRPTVPHIPTELQTTPSSSDPEVRRKYWGLSQEIAGQQVALARTLRAEMLSIAGQIPGAKEAALEGAFSGSGLILPLPDGKTLFVHGATKRQEDAGYHSRNDEYGDYIPDSAGRVSLEETSTQIGLSDPNLDFPTSLYLATKVWTFHAGDISGQDAQMNIHIPGVAVAGIGSFGCETPVEELLTHVDRFQEVLLGYTHG